MAIPSLDASFNQLFTSLTLNDSRPVGSSDRPASCPIPIPSSEELFPPCYRAVSASDLTGRHRSFDAAIDQFRSWSSSRPLTPASPLSSLSTSSDVYISSSCGDVPAVVFKPGQDAAHRGPIVYRLLCLHEISDIVAATKEGMIKQLIASQDVDASYVVRKAADATKWLVDYEDIYRLSQCAASGEGVFCIQYDEYHFTLTASAEKDLYRVEKKPAAIAPFISQFFSLVSCGDLFYLVPDSALQEGSQKDIQGDIQEDILLTVQRENKKYTVASQLCIEFDHITSQSVFHEGFEYAVIEDEGVYSLELQESPVVLETGECYRLFQHRGEHLLVPSTSCYKIEENNSVACVWRDGICFDLDPSEKRGRYTLTARDVVGAFQIKIESVFYGNDMRLDITKPSTERDSFYERINMRAFIRAFLATIIIRPQDGKIGRLCESNYLFEAYGAGDSADVDPQDCKNELRPVLIDLDETLPESNCAENGIVKVRSGLVAFPQARCILCGDLKKVVEDQVEAIYAKCSEGERYLNEVLGPKVAQSYKEVVHKMHEFICLQQSSFTLQQLFFHVFAEYKEQWECVLERYKSPEETALYVGLYALTDRVK